MENYIIILLFIGILLLIGCMKYKEGLENAESNVNPQTRTNEHQGTLTNLHKEIEEYKKKLKVEKIDVLNAEIEILNEQTKIVRNNMPDGQATKNRKT